MHFAGDDLVVGGLAMILGAVCMYGSLADQSWFFGLNKVRWLELRCGHDAARWICAAVAAFLIFLGLAIAMGFSVQRVLETNRGHTGQRVHGTGIPTPLLQV